MHQNRIEDSKKSPTDIIVNLQLSPCYFENDENTIGNQYCPIHHNRQYDLNNNTSPSVFYRQKCTSTNNTQSSISRKYRSLRKLLKTTTILTIFLIINVILIKLIAHLEVNRYSLASRSLSAHAVSNINIEFLDNENPPLTKILRHKTRVDSSNFMLKSNENALKKDTIDGTANYQYKKILLNVKNSKKKKIDDPARLTELSDIYFGIKSTQKFHRSRIDLLLKTWLKFTRDESYIFTDSSDDQLVNSPDGLQKDHVINTKCGSGHTRQNLCCKMSMEYDLFLASGKRWFCHGDDDTYFNFRRLVEILRQYPHNEAWYLGKPSLDHPMRYFDKTAEGGGKQIEFWFGTGGAGICLSRNLADRLAPLASSGKLMAQCDRIRLPDDVTLGYLIETVLGERLTVIEDFHSHLEGLWNFGEKQLSKMATFSYSSWTDHSMNTLDITRGFDHKADPTRILSAHCHLFPNLPQCLKIKNNNQEVKTVDNKKPVTQGNINIKASESRSKT